MKKIVGAVCAVIAALFLVTAVALTQDEQVMPAPGKGPCRSDVEKFCKGIKPGGGRIWACLKSHEAEISQPCKDQMAKGREKMKGFINACKEDRQKFCKDVRPGEGRIIACLKNHEPELSETCKAFFTKN